MRVVKVRCLAAREDRLGRCQYPSHYDWVTWRRSAFSAGLPCSPAPTAPRMPRSSCCATRSSCSSGSPGHRRCPRPTGRSCPRWPRLLPGGHLRHLRLIVSPAVARWAGARGNLDATGFPPAPCTLVSASRICGSCACPGQWVVSQKCLCRGSDRSAPDQGLPFPAQTASSSTGAVAIPRSVQAPASGACRTPAVAAQVSKCRARN